MFHLFLFKLKELYVRNVRLKHSKINKKRSTQAKEMNTFNIMGKTSMDCVVKLSTEVSMLTGSPQPALSCNTTSYLKR